MHSVNIKLFKVVNSSYPLFISIQNNKVAKLTKGKIPLSLGIKEHPCFKRVHSRKVREPYFTLF